MSCKKSKASEEDQDAGATAASQKDDTESIRTYLSTMATLQRLNIAEDDVDKVMHTGATLPLFTETAARACVLNIPTKMLFAPISAAELQDLKTTDKDPKELPEATARLPTFRVEKDPHDGSFRRFWQAATRAHIDRTCSRMWRPSKRVRQQLGDAGATEAARVELYTRCFPDRAAAGADTDREGDSNNTSSSNTCPEPRKWEVLLPSLVTFVLRDGAAADAADAAAPTAEIKYRQPGERNRQSPKAFIQALTASFACERVRAPDVGARWQAQTSHMRRRFVGRFVDETRPAGDKDKDEDSALASRSTMLVFAAGACVTDGGGGHTRGGVGLVTKDTIHFHEAAVLEKLIAAEMRLYGRPATPSAADARKLRLCVAALEKPNRGHSRNLYVAGAGPGSAAVCPLLGGTYSFALERRGPGIDPGWFGFVESRYQPAWKTLGDRRLDEGYYEMWLKTRDMVQVAMQQMAGLGGDGGEDGEEGEAKEEADDAKDVDDAEVREQAGNKIIDDDEVSEEEKRREATKGEPDTTEPKNMKENKTADASSKNKDDSADEEQKTTDQNPSNTRALPVPLETLRTIVELTTDTTPAPATPSITPTNTTTPAAASQSTPNNPSEPPTPHPATPNRAAARALLAAVHLHPLDLGHCTRLIIATDSDHAIEMATNRLQNMLERGLPLVTAKGKPVEDADLWWAFAGAVNDLAYQGVEVAVVRCRENEGVVLPFGGVGSSSGSDFDLGLKKKGGEWVFGVAQAARVAREAAERAVKEDVKAEMDEVIRGRGNGKGRKQREGEFARVMGMFV
ncbi:hypothetical protein C8A01DRAFT_37459 [Parachaetomium inaequale]|uniref:Uncharacterized protein n=1 Tax=Parachaetomium inaequale TaxID=2588326 RepID=A0AAN6PHG7_9PEZI|nr:hypothetical protein C8A01DRAFT_37459 [Parachaetomium inaequale]